MSIKQALLEGTPFLETIRERFPDYLKVPDALAYAIEGHLRGIPDIGAIDGFANFHMLEDTAATLRVTGLAYFRPSSLLPIVASFRIETSSISYRVLVGQEGDRWNGLSIRKRRASVYLYATERYEPHWNWGDELKGRLST